MNRDSEAMNRALGADQIAEEARRMASAAGVVPIGVTWDHGEQLVPKQSHILEIFRGNSYAAAMFSDAELTYFPDRVTKARTEVKLSAMVTDLVRRRAAAAFTASGKAPQTKTGSAGTMVAAEARDASRRSRVTMNGSSRAGRCPDCLAAG
jgi:hypothetical protein